MVRIAILSVLLSAMLAAGHPHGEDHGRRMSEDEIQARQVAGVKRHVAARSCAPQIAEYNQERRMKRELPMEKRALSSVKNPPGATATAGSQWNPAFSTLQNNTCVTAPEVTEGPYYTKSVGVLSVIPVLIVVLATVVNISVKTSGMDRPAYSSYSILASSTSGPVNLCRTLSSRSGTRT